MGDFGLTTGCRIEYKDARGTVRYVGTLHGQGERKWVGVEWDDAERGKHDGRHEKVQYFKCAAGAGSFVKADKVGFGGRRTLFEALSKRYGEDARDAAYRDEVVVVGGGLVRIENKAREKEFGDGKVSRVDCGGMGVYVIDEKAGEVLRRVSEVRLRGSLFDSVGFVIRALRMWTEMDVMDVSENVLGEMNVKEMEMEMEEEVKGHGLDELIANNCRLSWVGVRQMTRCMRHLRILRLHNCSLGKIGDGVMETLGSVELVDLDGNNVCWGDIMQRFGRLKALRELYVSKNGLKDTELAMEHGYFANVETLSIANNDIDGWRVISWLHTLRKLRAVRVEGNPVTRGGEDLAGRLTWRMRVIGRIGGVQVVDGSSISADERVYCEKRYLSDEISGGGGDGGGDAMEHPRADELRRRYGRVDRVLGVRNIRGDLVRVTLVGKGVGEREQVVRDMPRAAYMRTVRRVARRVLRIGQRFRMGIAEPDGTPVKWVDDEHKQLGFWVGTATNIEVVCGVERV